MLLKASVAQDDESVAAAWGVACTAGRSFAVGELALPTSWLVLGRLA
jgi:hypothetical protein